MARLWVTFMSENPTPTLATVLPKTLQTVHFSAFRSLEMKSHSERILALRKGVRGKNRSSRQSLLSGSIPAARTSFLRGKNRNGPVSLVSFCDKTKLMTGRLAWRHP